jgi:hypothetical protein
MGAAVSRNLLPSPSSSQMVSRRGNGFFSFLLLLLALAFTWTCREYGPQALQRWFLPLSFESPADLLLLLGAVASAMFVHEGGHLLASTGCGFRLLGGSLGPLQVQGLHGKWKISFSPRTFFTASISAVPTSMNHWRAAMIFVIAAGPAATLGAAVTIAHLAATGHFAVFSQAAFVQVSMLVFILGLIPNNSCARTPNDMRLLLDLILRNAGAEEIELNVLLSQQIIGGIRPQDYPVALLSRLATWRRRPESQFIFAQAMVRWALDSEMMELADLWDLRAVALAEECNSRMQNTALASSACIDVILREDLESARTKFARVDFTALFPECFEQRARAAHQIALGRLYRASPHIIRAQYALPRGVEACALERALLERLHMIVLSSSHAPRATKFNSASA